MALQNNNPQHRNPWLYIVIGLAVLGLTMSMLLRGTDIALLSPKGLIAGEQYSLMPVTTAVLLLIAVPTLFAFYFVAWKYRDTNARAEYDPNAQQSTSFQFYIWAIPSVFMVVLSVVMWSATHQLEPKKALASNVKPLTIQVVALPWKWLFIYPEQKIATVNFIQVPTGTPVRFELTADKVPMSSFWIPHLSGQLYAMTGHVNRLNIMADTTGDYPGSSAEINGAGFSGMKFIARVSTQAAYDNWVQDVRQDSAVLGSAGYAELLKPSENNLAVFYNLDDPDLYNSVVMKYMGSHGHDDVGSAEHKEAGPAGHHSQGAH